MTEQTDTRSEPDAAPPATHHPPLEASARFRPPPTRRDFLGLAAIWSAAAAFVAAVIGAVRLPMPSVFPESSAKVKIGPAEAFPRGSATHLPHLNLWVCRDEGGLYAISAVCTHLGCIAARDSATGQFLCPCHGSVFESNGKVVAGPAPSGLNWLAVSVAPDGQVMVDQRQTVKAGTRLSIA